MLVLSILRLKRMRLPLKKNNLATSIESTIDSAIPCLGIDIHTRVWNYMNRNIHCSILCESKALERKKMSIHRGLGRSIMEHPYNGMLWRHYNEWGRAGCTDPERSPTYIIKLKKKKKLPAAYQSSSTNVEYQTKQLVYPQFAWKKGGNAGRDSGQLSEMAT